MSESTDSAQTAQVSHANPVTQAGFTMIPNAVMLRADLGAEAKLIYGYLKHLAWRNGHGPTDPPRDVIAADLGISEKKVTAALRELATEGDDGTPALLTVIRRGQGRTNVYLIADPETTASPEVNRDLVAQKNAWQALNDAVRRGEVTRGTCAVCGSDDVEGHHEDYDRPLDVTWLCPAHHREVHASRRAEIALLERPIRPDPARARSFSGDKNRTLERPPPIPPRIVDVWIAHAPPLIAHRPSYLNEQAVKRKIIKAVERYGEPSVVSAIMAYADVLASPAHFFNYRWTIGDFLTRGLDRFVPEADPLENFRRNRDGLTPAEIASGAWRERL